MLTLRLPTLPLNLIEDLASTLASHARARTVRRLDLTPEDRQRANAEETEAPENVEDALRRLERLARSEGAEEVRIALLTDMRDAFNDLLEVAAA